METLKTINAFIRTLLALVVVAALIGTGWLVTDYYTRQDRLLSQRQRELEQVREELGQFQEALEVARQTELALKEELAERDARIDRLETAMALLKVDQRLARLEVLEVSDAEPGEGEAEGEGEQAQGEAAPSVRVRFVELTPSGDPLGQPREYRFSSDVLYVDNWIVKFDDAFVEASDIQRGTSLCLFRRIFGENQSPNEGYLLDQVGMRPQAYARGGRLSEFETEIWSQFWEFANDPKKAAEMGIRAANGEAVSIQVRPGMAYHIELRSSGGLSITPMEAER